MPHAAFHGVDPEITAFGPLAVLGIRISTNPMSSEIPALWQVFGPRIDEVSDIAEPGVSYGIMEKYDAAAGTLDYMAAVSVPFPASGADGLAAPEGMSGFELGANNYAVFEATLATIGEAFGFIFNQWLAKGDYVQIKAPYFERYGADFNPADPHSKIQIYIPVQRRA